LTVFAASYKITLHAHNITQRKGDLLLHKRWALSFTATVLTHARLCTRTKLIWIVICVNSAQLEPRLRRASLCVAALITLRLHLRASITSVSRKRVNAHANTNYLGKLSRRWKYLRAEVCGDESRARTRKLLHRRDELLTQELYY